MTSHAQHQAVIICHHRRFVFVAVPKTGSTTVHHAFTGIDDTEEPPHVHHRGIAEALANDAAAAIDSYFKFAFVRNPWDRLVSAFHNFTQQEEHFEWSDPLRRYPDFRSFCLDFPTSRWPEWIHFRPQLYFLSVDGRLAMDFVGRFERLEADFETVRRTVGLDPKRLAYVRPSRHEPYLDYYDETTRAIVGEVYAADIEAFGYRFDPLARTQTVGG